jgi:SAM-dependent methyltransferase/uncharacterized protein YbaR (Trm112 family)
MHGAGPDPWYIENLVCPVDGTPLTYSDGELGSAAGRRYPVVDGTPVMLMPEVQQTIGVASASLRRARGDATVIDSRAPHLYLESLGISEEEKSRVLELAGRSDARVDPVASMLIGATSGYSYKHMIGSMSSYPIPELRLEAGDGRRLLDLGCNWGRWCIAAARKGYDAVGIDPQLGAVKAAQRVAKQLGLAPHYLVADARYLPFRKGSFDVVFSYSVLQHLSKDDVKKVLSGIGKVLAPHGTSLVQMANAFGLRSLQHQAKRRFREAQEFEVRYWSVPELRRVFSELIGTSKVEVDCFFGLGLQASDRPFMTTPLKGVIDASEGLRSLARFVHVLKYAADSVYVRSVR